MKKLTKIIYVITAAILLTYIIAACGPRIDTDKDTGETPRVITDHAGRTVIIEGIPQRIISGYYISSSVLIALGAADQMVGIEARASSRPIYSLAAPQLLELPDVGTARDFNLEACLALEPDLVILPLRLLDTAEILDELGVPAILVNPESFDELIEMIIMTGIAIGAMEPADLLTDYIRSALTDIHNLTVDLTERPSVYIGGVGTYLSTAPEGMFQSSLIDIAGGLNAAADLPGSSRQEISYEQLLLMDPDIMIIPSEAGYEADDIKSDNELTHLSAVVNNKIYKMPADFEAWDSPLPSGILGALWLLNTLYDDLYSTVDFTRAVTGFYKEFYKFDAEIAS